MKLFAPTEQDIKIIKHDFETIVEKIKAGKAHELSEGDTLYLGAAPKAATSKDRRKQPFSDELAKPRAFAFKNSYMTYVLNNYIIPGKSTYEPIIKENAEESFEDYVVQKINTYNDFLIDILKNKQSKINLIQIINYIVNIFLLISFYIMIAGFVSFFKQEYNLSPYIIVIITTLMCYIILS